MNRVDLETERWFLGAALLRPDMLPVEAWALTPEDFFDREHLAIWDAILAMHAENVAINNGTVSAWMRNHGNAPDGISTKLMTLISEAPRASGASMYVPIIKGHSAARRMQAIHLDAAEALNDPTKKAVDSATVVCERLMGIARGSNPFALPEGYSNYEELMFTEETDQKPWVIPGLMREGWRTIVVAAEGVGKGVLLRQFAICAANGIHPLNHQPMPAISSVTVDLENPDEVIVHQAELVSRNINKPDLISPKVWRRGAGMDLRNAGQFAELHRVCAEVQPKLVVFGPLYKAYRSDGRNSDDQVLGEVLARLDELRAEFGFAILIEHHAPKGAPGGGGRAMAPFGSSVLLRWPEFGIGLKETGRNEFKLTRWRQDRMPAKWPSHLIKSEGTGWPWTARYADGTFREERRAA